MLPGTDTIATKKARPPCPAAGFPLSSAKRSIVERRSWSLHPDCHVVGSDSPLATLQKRKCRADTNLLPKTGAHRRRRNGRKHGRRLRRYRIGHARFSHAPGREAPECVVRPNETLSFPPHGGRTRPEFTARRRFLRLSSEPAIPARGVPSSWRTRMRKEPETLRPRESFGKPFRVCRRRV